LKLDSLFYSLAEVFDGTRAIEQHARQALESHAKHARVTGEAVALPQVFLDVMSAADAHPVCELVAQIPFHWAPPKTSSDPLYQQHSAPKVHVELIGPQGVAKSDQIRMGLYGMLPNAEYGIRTHPAEEIYIMLAGQALWKRGSDDYVLSGAGDRSYHPSMMEHANRTAETAFMSIYVWHGDISTENYTYSGIPGG